MRALDRPSPCRRTLHRSPRTGVTSRRSASPYRPNPQDQICILDDDKIGRMSDAQQPGGAQPAVRCPPAAERGLPPAAKDVEGGIQIPPPCPRRSPLLGSVLLKGGRGQGRAGGRAASRQFPPIIAAKSSSSSGIALMRALVRIDRPTNFVRSGIAAGPSKVSRLSFKLLEKTALNAAAPCPVSRSVKSSTGPPANSQPRKVPCLLVSGSMPLLNAICELSYVPRVYISWKVGHDLRSALSVPLAVLPLSRSVKIGSRSSSHHVTTTHDSSSWIQ